MCLFLQKKKQPKTTFEINLLSKSFHFPELCIYWQSSKRFTKRKSSPVSIVLKVQSVHIQMPLNCTQKDKFNHIFLNMQCWGRWSETFTLPSSWQLTQGRQLKHGLPWCTELQLCSSSSSNSTYVYHASTRVHQGLQMAKKTTKCNSWTSGWSQRTNRFLQHYIWPK